jgi:hypothetical protein
VFLTLIGATTPDSIANCIPASASGTGFTSRIIFCYADKKHIKVAEPEETADIIRLRDVLIRDLDIISRMSGEYVFSPEGRKYWHKWYNEYDDLDPNRRCKDPMFNGWYERKPTFILKIALIMAASLGDYDVIHPHHMEEALRFIEGSEWSMDSSFRVVGRSEIASEIDLVLKIVENHGQMTEQELMQLIWKDVDALKLINVMDTAVKTGKIQRIITAKDVSYKWRGMER